MTIADNIQRIQEAIEAACARAGRNPAEVTLIAVSKTHPAEVVLEAASFGLQHFGENRVEEAELKIPSVNARSNCPLTWHMVGHIQSRKARDVTSLFQQVHSVDTLKLASKLSGLCMEQGKQLRVLLEMNVSGEEAKYGFQATSWDTNHAVRDHLWREVEQILALPGIEVRGLMTMAPIVEQVEQARPVFTALARLCADLRQSFQIELPDLSMGMTDDYPVAVEEGATLVRIGRAIFGEREHK